MEDPTQTMEADGLMIQSLGPSELDIIFPRYIASAASGDLLSRTQDAFGLSTFSRKIYIKSIVFNKKFPETPR